MSTTTGIIGDGYKFDPVVASTLATASSTKFAFDPAGASGGTMFFWYKIDFTNPSEPAFEFRYDGAAIAFVVSGATDGSLTVSSLDVNGYNGTVTFAGPMDVSVWHFVVATFDNATGDVKLYVDNADPLVGSGYEQILADAITEGTVTLTQLAPDLNVSVDEFGLSLTSAYSADQVEALWNDGAGMTWPDVNSV